MSTGLGLPTGPALRPEITRCQGTGKILRNGQSVRVELSKDRIKVGCSDISPEALVFLVEEWRKYFGGQRDCVVLQQD